MQLLEYRIERLATVAALAQTLIGQQHDRSAFPVDAHEIAIAIHTLGGGGQGNASSVDACTLKSAVHALPGFLRTDDAGACAQDVLVIAGNAFGKPGIVGMNVREK